MPRRQMPVEWGRLSHLFDEINQHFIDYRQQADFLLQCIERHVPRARRALDLGCATGLHARLLAESDLDVVGVDISRRLLQRARHSARGLEAQPRFACADLAALPLKSRFDLVYALNFVMSFLHTNEALLGALSEIQRVLSRRGILVLDYHYYFPPDVEQTLREPWEEQCVVRGQQLVVVHHPTVDWSTQLCTDEMTYRFMQDDHLVREITTTEVRRISFPQDLVCILQASGLDVIAHCARFDLDAEPGETGVLIAKRGRR